MSDQKIEETKEATPTPDTQATETTATPAPAVVEETKEA